MGVEETEERGGWGDEKTEKIKTEKLCVQDKSVWSSPLNQQCTRAECRYTWYSHSHLYVSLLQPLSHSDIACLPPPLILSPYTQQSAPLSPPLTHARRLPFASLTKKKLPRYDYLFPTVGKFTKKKEKKRNSLPRGLDCKNKKIQCKM